VKEYTILALLVALAALALDFALKTNLARQKRFWIFWAVMSCMMTMVNGYLTWRPIVLYGEDFFLGMRLITIPLEDYFYGFGLITSNIVLWEYYTKRHGIPDAPDHRNEIHG
jgi:lycopene cyclase domain-containing protein